MTQPYAPNPRPTSRTCFKDQVGRHVDARRRAEGGTSRSICARRVIRRTHPERPSHPSTIGAISREAARRVGRLSRLYLALRVSLGSISGHGCISLARRTPTTAKLVDPTTFCDAQGLSSFVQYYRCVMLHCRQIPVLLAWVASRRRPSKAITALSR